MAWPLGRGDNFAETGGGDETATWNFNSARELPATDV